MVSLFNARMGCLRLLRLSVFVAGLWAAHGGSDLLAQPNVPAAESDPVADPLTLATLTPQELAEGWILLFDGQTDFGWSPTSGANWTIAEGEIRVSQGEKGLLCTTCEFADYILSLDFKADAGTNSGIFLRTPRVPTDPAKDCYELNIAAADVSPFYTGSLVGRGKAKNPPKPEDAGVWHHYDVTLLGDTVTVVLDGETVLTYQDQTPLARGVIGLQLNSGAVAFRNVKLKPLAMKPLLAGRDWREFPGKKAVFSVGNAESPDPSTHTLHVENGDGQLETQGQYADFVLQLEAITHGERLNSGIFFRCIPGEFWQGYESQIQNGFLEGDRHQPADCGTGGFYRRQNARFVMSDDNQWFSKTLVVTGNHMAAWINGVQVSDWTDTRAENENPRKGLRLKAGTISVQAHDATTNLDFRQMRIAEIPPASAQP